MASADQTHTSAVLTQHLRSTILRGAALAAAGGVLFILTLVAFSSLREFYEAESREAIIEVLRAHRGEIYTAWSIMAVGDVLVGLGVWVIARAISSTEFGRLASAARTAGRLSLGACFMTAAIRVLPPPGVMSLESMADMAESWIFKGTVFLVWIAYSLAYLTLGVVLVKARSWPTWLGVALGLLAIPPLVTFLPLFYALGAILLGGTLLLRRSPTADVMQASAN